MAMWTITVFVVIFAIVMAVLWIPLFNVPGASALGAVGQAFAAGWVIFVVVAVLCFATYFGYKYYLNSKK
jgi:hypothetical protein